MFKSICHELTLAFNPSEWKLLLDRLHKITFASFLTTLKLLIPQLVVYYIILCPVIAVPLYNHMLFHPTMSGPFDAHKITGHDIENVAFKSHNGVELHGWYVPLTGANRVVLISHGNGGNLTDRIPLVAMFLRSGVSVFVYDYQGYGRSQGSPSIENICADGEAAYDWLVSKKGFRPEQIIAFGESLGSGVACRLSTQRKVGAIILQSGFSSLVELAKQKVLLLRVYPVGLFPKPELNNAKVLSMSHVPLLLVHGQQDRLIPFSHSQKIFETALPPKTLIALPNAGHNDIYGVDNAQYFAGVKQFLETLN